MYVVKSKCLSVLLYGLEVCPLNISHLRLLDFVIKLFKINVIDTVKV